MAKLEKNVQKLTISYCRYADNTLVLVKPGGVFKMEYHIY